MSYLDIMYYSGIPYPAWDFMVPAFIKLPRPVIGVGRCSDLGGGGDIFFKQQKCDFLEEQCLHEILQ